MTQKYNNRNITLNIAGKGDNRKTTTEQSFSLNHIYVVSSPQGTGGKGALIYTTVNPKPLQTVQTFSFKDWCEEIDRKDEQTGKPVYAHAFLKLGPRLMVNLETITDRHLDRKNNRICLPPSGSGATFDLDKEQFALLTREVSKGNDYWFRFLKAAFTNYGKTLAKEKAEAKENAESSMGCLFALFILLVINTALLIAILCIVA